MYIYVDLYIYIINLYSIGGNHSEQHLNKQLLPAFQLQQKAPCLVLVHIFNVMQSSLEGLCTLQELLCLSTRSNNNAGPR